MEFGAASFPEAAVRAVPAWPCWWWWRSCYHVQTLRDAYAAFAGQDVPSVMAAFHGDIEWESPDSIPFGSTYNGHDGVGHFFIFALPLSHGR